MARLLLIFFIFLSGLGFHTKPIAAQKASNVLHLTPQYGAYMPLGNLSERFGFSQSFGFSGDYIWGGKLGLGLEGQYHFGNKVKENDLLNSLLSSGFMVGDDGDLVPVGFEQRGMSLMTWLSKNFPFSPKSPNSGLLVKVGMGYTLHKISYNVDRNAVPQFSPQYRTGYDRLSGGIVFSQFIGLMKCEQQRFANLYLGIEFQEGLTSNLRPWDLATNTSLDASRFDLRIGLKLGWIIPVWTGASTEDDLYYY